MNSANFILLCSVVTFSSALSVNKPNEPIDFLKQFAQLTKIKSNNDDPCQSCQSLVNTVKQALTNSELQNDLSKVLLEVCISISDQQQRETCQTVLTSILPVFLDGLANHLDSSTICVKAFHLCPAVSSAVLVDANGPVVKDIECAACEWGIFWVYYGLMNPDCAKSLVWSLYHGFCVKYFGNPEQSQQCQSYVEQVGELMVDMPALFPPQTVCQLVNVCPAPPPTNFNGKTKI